MTNLRHCVSCLAQSSGRGCGCCGGLSLTVIGDIFDKAYLTSNISGIPLTIRSEKL